MSASSRRASGDRLFAPDAKTFDRFVNDATAVFGINIAGRRVERQLAKAAGISYQTIRRLEAGDDAGELRLGMLARIAAELNAPIPALLHQATGAHEEDPGLDHGPVAKRITLNQARLLRKIATKTNAAATLTKTEREITLPALLRTGQVTAHDGHLALHPDVAATLLP